MNSASTERFRQGEASPCANLQVVHIHWVIMVQLANTTHHHIYHPLFTNPQAIALRFETWQPISYLKYIICLTHIKQEPSIHEPKYTEQRHPTSINHFHCLSGIQSRLAGEKKRTKWRLLLGRENHKTKPCGFSGSDVWLPAGIDIICN